MTIEQQIETMALDFPEWRVEREGLHTAVWTGTLKPNRISYQIRIEHTVPMILETHSLIRLQPLVEILSPKLEEQEGNSEGPLPHVYWKHPRTKREGPFLCLFDPDAREWTLSDPLSRTTVPWTAFWLDNYEAWLVTGRWFGKGRHVGRNSADDIKTKQRRRNRHISLLTGTAVIRHPL